MPAGLRPTTDSWELLIIVLGLNIAWWPIASKTTSWANVFEQSFLL